MWKNLEEFDAIFYLFFSLKEVRPLPARTWSERNPLKDEIDELDPFFFCGKELKIKKFFFVEWKNSFAWKWDGKLFFELFFLKERIFVAFCFGCCVGTEEDLFFLFRRWKIFSLLFFKMMKKKMYFLCVLFWYLELTLFFSHLKKKSHLYQSSTFSHRIFLKINFSNLIF